MVITKKKKKVAMADTGVQEGHRRVVSRNVDRSRILLKFFCCLFGRHRGVHTLQSHIDEATDYTICTPVMILTLTS